MRKEPIIIKILAIIITFEIAVGFVPAKAEAVLLWPVPHNPPSISWRINIQPGDILYDKDAVYSDLLGVFEIGHTAMYVGDLNKNGHVYYNQEIESELKPGVTHNNISSWDYPRRDNVYLLRVSANNQVREAAVNFVKTQFQLSKPYDWHWWQKSADPSSPSWYCSELDWAAYLNASNQSINLDKNPNTPWVSPKEIFESPYTYIISSHDTNRRDFFKGFVFIFASPIDAEVRAPNGEIISKTENQIPGAYYIEDYQLENGKTADLIILPEGSPDGQYLVKVIREPGAPPNSVYSLEVYQGGGEGDSKLIVKEHPVPATGQVDTYSVDVDPPVRSAHFGFSDTANSSADSFQAGRLSLSLQSPSNFAPLVSTSTPAIRQASLINSGSLPLQYQIKVVNISGQLCDHLTLKAELNGTEEYNGPILAGQSLLPAPLILNQSQQDNWGFVASLNSSDKTLQGETCHFDFDVQAWQTNIPNYGDGGFTDEKTVTNVVMAGDWTGPVISDVSYSISTPGQANEPEAIITWQTDEISNSYVDYGLDTNYGSTAGQDDVTTSHSVDISGLATSTTYHFRVKSKDSSGNQSVSGDYNFIIDDPHFSTSTSNIVLNEILPDPQGADDQQGIQGEWVELYNKGNVSIDLSGWYLQDAAGHKIVIGPSNTLADSATIGANGSGSEWLVVLMNGSILNNTGDTVALYNSGNSEVDSYQYTTGQVTAGKSIARYPDGSDTWYDPIPTPGQSNQLAKQK